MIQPTSIHHINFIVENLEESISQYQTLLGLGAFEIEDLAARGARTARINLNGVWLVLVSPTRPDSVPGQFLQTHGEGFFLLSFGINDLESALKYYESRGIVSPGAEVRKGLLDWRVVDLNTQEKLGAMFHLTDIKN